MAEAAEIIQGGTSIWIAPEGTRSRDGRIGRLKRGGFRLAIETGTPIVPVRIDGTNAILPPGARLLGAGGRVTVHFGALMPVRDRDEQQLIAELSVFLAA